MKKVLLIDESKPFRNFVTQKLERLSIEVTQAITGLDAVSKMRSEQPDLTIMDYNLSRMGADEVLKQKIQNPNTAKTPVILVSSKIGREEIVKAGSYGVKKFFFKPIKLDEFIAAVGQQLEMTIAIDETPSVTEVHVNDGVLFIEVALGLNVDKIDLLQFKIGELIELYRLNSPKVLIMLSGFDVSSADSIKIRSLLETVLESSRSKSRNIVMLTHARIVRELLNSDAEFKEIKLVDSLNDAMTILQGRSKDGESFVSQNSQERSEAAIDMRFSSQKVADAPQADILKGAAVVIVDDDPVIQELAKTTFEGAGCAVQVYENGRCFVDDCQIEAVNLVFLDLMMPEMDGFRVLQNLQSRFASDEMPPVIVFSAVSRRDAVVKALQSGVKSYLIKPLKPHQLREKAIEVLSIDFA